MTWLFITLIAYFLLAVVFLIDKFLLTSSIPNPKTYAFYSGFFGLLILLLIPFTGFSFPSLPQIILSFLTGIFFTFGLVWFYKALQIFEPSRVAPAVGGFLPLFTAGLVYVIFQETLSQYDFLAFILLLSGSVLIAYEKSKKVSFKSIKISLVAAVFFALYFVLAKYVYLQQPFWSGYAWIRIGAFFSAIFLLLFSDVREEIFKNKKIIPRNAKLYFLSQGFGVGANLLQNLAVALSPLAYLAVINALQGAQYVFLLILTVFLSFKFPQILKEEISQEIIFQKIIAILLISGGLVLLAFNL